MYRAIPSASKILTNKWQDKSHEIHLKNLNKIKGTIDMRQPQQFKHLQKKMKKTQMMEERYTEIERENRILLEKMTNILQKQRGNLFSANSAGAVAQQQYGQSQPPGHRSYLQTSGDMTLQPIGSAQAGPRRSLNREARKRELVKITRENQNILKRLQEKSANYNIQRWQREEETRKKVLSNICEYPLQDRASVHPDFIITRKKMGTAQSGQPFYKKTKGYATGAGKGQQYVNQIIKKASLYTGEHDLGNGLYLIEMLISQSDDLVISAQHTQLPDSFIIEIEAQKVNQLITEFSSDFSHMAQYLKIMNKRMVLLNPKFINKQQDGEEGQESQPEVLNEDQIAHTESQENRAESGLEQNEIYQDEQQQNGSTQEQQDSGMGRSSPGLASQEDQQQQLPTDAQETPVIQNDKSQSIQQDVQKSQESINQSVANPESRLSNTQKPGDSSKVYEQQQSQVDLQGTADAKALANIENNEAERQEVQI